MFNQTNLKFNKNSNDDLMPISEDKEVLNHQLKANHLTPDLPKLKVYKN